MRDDLDLDRYRRLLEAKLSALESGREARRREEEPVELDQARVGRLSRMDALQQQAMARAAARRTEVERQRIRAALERLRCGEYGYCVRCEEEIDEKRLRVDPAAPACIACARAADGR